jgi:hypothetical protein
MNSLHDTTGVVGHVAPVYSVSNTGATKVLGGHDSKDKALAPLEAP